MIIGAHSIIYSKNADLDRRFLGDVLDLTSIDAGDGWLIFGLPPAEVAVHPSEKNDIHELYLMCDDVEAFIAEMKKKKIACSPSQDLGWGVLTEVNLPGGGKLGVYEPRHAHPEMTTRPKTAKRPAKHASKRPSKSSKKRTTKRR